MARQIYKHDQAFKNAYHNLMEGIGLSNENKAIMKDFFDLLQAEGLTKARRTKYALHWKNLFKWIDKPIMELGKEELIKVAGKINDMPWKPTTQEDHFGAVKKLYATISTLPKYETMTPIYQWLYDRRNKFFKKKNGKPQEKEEWFTEQDIIDIINASNNPRDKAMIAIFASQGLRPSELLTLKQQDIKPDENGYRLKVIGKTGVRDVLIIEPWVIKHLEIWLNQLPKSEEYVFDLTLKRASDILKGLCRISGITKRAHLYKLRKHSVTQDRVKGLSSQFCEAKYGWVKASRVITHYDKSVSKDYFKELRIKYGLIEEKKEDKFKERKCLKCSTLNEYSSKFCSSCGVNLHITQDELIRREDSQKQMAYLEQKMAKFDRFVEWLESNQEIRSIIEEQAH